MKGTIIEVPLAPLAVDGTPPGEGDSVSLTIDGVVKSVSGTSAKIEVQKINDQDAAAPDESDDAEPTEPTEDSMSQAAQAEDAANGAS